MIIAKIDWNGATQVIAASDSMRSAGYMSISSHQRFPTDRRLPLIANVFRGSYGFE
jgi:hypothetical protein